MYSKKLTRGSFTAWSIIIKDYKKAKTEVRKKSNSQIPDKKLSKT